ncbi:hypothetical protein [Microtetraspora malaysiensis]|uniref:hypothetical protein n=1 Tax=Microtetraspora malaysiensis TaxID=161358 RepID=UPI000AEB7855|nr:hypothetical protein [Microtetraspora malaysiensis]
MTTTRDPVYTGFISLDGVVDEAPETWPRVPLAVTATTTFPSGVINAVYTPA